MNLRTVPLAKLLSDNTAEAAPELVRKLDDDTVQCLACGHRCKIKPGRQGICRVRFNEGGTLRVPHGYVAGLAVDPIEKKPFYHAFPGTEALSFGMLGCDFHCSYCQNWVSSQTLRDERATARPNFVSPQRVVELALEHGCKVLTSTYNEPLITSEWAVDIFKLGRRHGLVGSYVSNGNATPEVLEYIRPYVDMYKIDLKAFSDRTYRELGGVLANTLDTIRRTKQLGFWVEVVTLVVPGLNDSDEELRQIAEFVAGVSTEIPWHVTAFHPEYKMTDPPRTPVETLIRAYDIGRAAGLQFVYPGNVAGGVGTRENTYCPDCGALLIERRGFRVLKNGMKAGRCPDCDAQIPGVWEVEAPRQSVGPGIPRPAL